MSKYTVRIDGQDATSYARKDAAIRFGTDHGLPFEVVTEAGNVVYTSPELEEAPEPAAQPAEGKAPAATKKTLGKHLRLAEEADTDDESNHHLMAALETLVELQIQHAEKLAGGARPDKITTHTRNYANVYAKNLARFGEVVAVGYGPVATEITGRWSKAELHLLGHAKDVELFDFLLDSLERQALAALERWQKENRAERKGQNNYRRLVGNRSFLAGWAEQVQGWMVEVRHKRWGDAGDEAQRVLAERQAEVAEAEVER